MPNSSSSSMIYQSPMSKNLLYLHNLSITVHLTSNVSLEFSLSWSPCLWWSKSSVSELVNVKAWDTECEQFASWPNYPHCAEIQCHAHCVVAWPNGIVYQAIWATFWHAYVMFWSNSLSTQIYCFTQQNPFSFLRSEKIQRSWSRFSHSRGIMHDSCHL